MRFMGPKGMIEMPLELNLADSGTNAPVLGVRFRFVAPLARSRCYNGVTMTNGMAKLHLQMHKLFRLLIRCSRVILNMGLSSEHYAVSKLHRPQERLM